MFLESKTADGNSEIADIITASTLSRHYPVFKNIGMGRFYLRDDVFAVRADVQQGVESVSLV